jgi:hypothetical protein
VRAQRHRIGQTSEANPSSPRLLATCTFSVNPAPLARALRTRSRRGSCFCASHVACSYSFDTRACGVVPCVSFGGRAL